MLQEGHVPLVAGLLFFSVTLIGFLISTFFLHFMQYAWVIAIPPFVVSLGSPEGVTTNRLQNSCSIFTEAKHCQLVSIWRPRLRPPILVYTKTMALQKRGAEPGYGEQREHWRATRASLWSAEVNRSFITRGS